MTLYTVDINGSQIWPQKIDDINYLEYFLEFSPENNKYTSTSYSLNIQMHENSIINVNVTFENLGLTMYGENICYNISADSFKIYEIYNSSYESYIKDLQTELFYNLSNIGVNQTFRIDETITFAPFFETTTENGMKQIETTFVFMGIEQYEDNYSLQYPLTTYHYNTSYSWVGAGCS